MCSCSNFFSKIAKVGIVMLKTVGNFLYLLFRNDISKRKRKNKNVVAKKEIQRDAKIAELQAKKLSDERRIRELRARAMKGDITAHGEWLEMVKLVRKNERS